MKILTINSSYRKNGNTESIMKLLNQHFLEEGKKRHLTLEIENISLRTLQISPCRGCRQCLDASEKHCPCKDDVPLIYEKMKNADGIVLGSPVYVEDVNGLMKNWIDRMAFNCYRPFLSGKPVMLLITSGAGGSKHALRTLETAISVWGGTIAGNQLYRMGRLMSQEEAKLYFDQILKKHSLRFLNTLGNTTPSLYSLIAFNIQQKIWRLDRTGSSSFLYWKENGWLEKRCNYYTNKKSIGIKVLIARIISYFIGLILIKRSL